MGWKSTRWEACMKFLSNLGSWHPIMNIESASVGIPPGLLNIRTLSAILSRVLSTLLFCGGNY